MDAFKHYEDVMRAEQGERISPWTTQQKSLRRRRGTMRERRDHFLKATHATVTPVDLYALWVGHYLENGGRISYMSGETFVKDSARGMIGGFSDIARPSPLNHAQEPRIWLPITWHDELRIPEGYRTTSMSVFAFTGGSGLHNYQPNLAPSDSRTNGRRRGWEYGLTQLYTLNMSTGEARTNRPDVVRMYTDVEMFLNECSFDQLRKSVSLKLAKLNSLARMLEKR